MLGHRAAAAAASGADANGHGPGGKASAAAAAMSPAPATPSSPPLGSLQADRPVPAAASRDIWSMGMVFVEMATGMVRANEAGCGHSCESDRCCRGRPRHILMCLYQRHCRMLSTRLHMLAPGNNCAIVIVYVLMMHHYLHRLRPLFAAAVPRDEGDRDLQRAGARKEARWAAVVVVVGRP